MTEKVKRKSPVLYTSELGKQICEALSKNFDVTLNDVITDEAGNQHPEMPTPNAVYRWINSHPEFKELYEQARKEQAEKGHDLILERNRHLWKFSSSMKMPEVSAITQHINNLKYVTEKRLWKYNQDLENRLEKLEERLK